VALGVEPGDRIALIAENGIDWALAYYGTVLAGCASVPIYFELKPAEIAGMSRAEFITGLARFGVSPFQYGGDELADELGRG